MPIFSQGFEVGLSSSDLCHVSVKLIEKAMKEILIPCQNKMKFIWGTYEMMYVEKSPDFTYAVMCFKVI